MSIDNVPNITIEDVVADLDYHYIDGVHTLVIARETIAMWNLAPAIDPRAFGTKPLEDEAAWATFHTAAKDLYDGLELSFGTQALLVESCYEYTFGPAERTMEQAGYDKELILSYWLCDLIAREVADVKH